MRARAFLPLVLGACFLGISEAAPDSKVSDEAANCYEEGYALFSGTERKADAAAARAMLERAVVLGSDKAKGLLGYMLAEGVGGPPDLRRGFDLIQAAATAGIASARLNLASMLEKGRGADKDVPRAIELYGQAAEQGLLDAHLRLADFYYFGTTEVPRDYRRALPHVRFAAGKGVPGMQNLLGVIYEYGHGVDPDYSEARLWYREAALQGDAKGQSNLGRIIRLRNSKPSDLVESAQWTKLAANQGEPTAKVALLDMEKALDSYQIEKVERFVVDFKPILKDPIDTPQSIENK